MNNFKQPRLCRSAAAILAAGILFTPFAQAQTETYSYQKFIKGLPSEVPAGAASPAILDFGEVQMPGVSPWLTVTYSNLGNTDLSIGEVTVPAGFEVQSGCPAILTLKQTCEMQVRFAPVAPGVASGTMSIASTSYDSPDVVALTAVATQPVAAITPSAINLGEVEVGVASQPASLTVTNTGTGLLQLANLTFGGSDQGFAVTEGSCSPLPKQLGSQESCAMTVNVTPLAQGPLSGVVNVTTNDAAGARSVPLQATGIQAAIALSPASLAFGDVLTGTVSAPQTINVSNTGTGKLQVATVTRTGTNSTEFASTNTCGSAVLPGGSCSITVTANPASKGTKSAGIEIVSNAPTSPTVALLSANATQGEATIDPATWDFGTVAVGP